MLETPCGTHLPPSRFLRQAASLHLGTGSGRRQKPREEGSDSVHSDTIIKKSQKTGGTFNDRQQSSYGGLCRPGFMRREPGSPGLWRHLLHPSLCWVQVSTHRECPRVRRGQARTGRHQPHQQAQHKQTPCWRPRITASLFSGEDWDMPSPTNTELEGERQKNNQPKKKKTTQKKNQVMSVKTKHLSKSPCKQPTPGIFFKFCFYFF